MKETFRPLDRQPANILIFNAMAALVPPREHPQALRHEERGGKTTATIEVFVNGVAVPFKGAFDEAVKAVFARYDKDLEDAAINRLKSIPMLSNLYNAIEDAEWKIREALAAITKEQQ